MRKQAEKNKRKKQAEKLLKTKKRSYPISAKMEMQVHQSSLTVLNLATQESERFCPHSRMMVL